MTDDQAKAEELLQQSKSQTRKDTEPSEESTRPAETPPLEESIRTAYHELDDGDLRENLTIRDENLAALFAGLEASDQLATVGQDAAEVLDRDETAIETRAGVLRFLVRIGLNEVDPALIEAGKEGLDRYEDDKRELF
ncbi:hypothetical protein ACLI4Z_16630 (plasmid) [Natrialbaceae archaeon A-arb3/5]